MTTRRRSSRLALSSAHNEHDIDDDIQELRDEIIRESAALQRKKIRLDSLLRQSRQPISRSDVQPLLDYYQDMVNDKNPSIPRGYNFKGYSQYYHDDDSDKWITSSGVRTDRFSIDYGYSAYNALRNLIEMSLEDIQSFDEWSCLIIGSTKYFKAKKTIKHRLYGNEYDLITEYQLEIPI